jgi:TRAP-type C4-dicarboxylate transport system permease small subunit
LEILLSLTNGLGVVNAALLALGRWLGAICLGLMVVAILTQVFFRYVLGHALPWPEEASRFLMLWSTGLMAPTAFRRGGFVAIDMVIRFLPRLVATGLSVFLMVVTIIVLWVALGIGWSEVTGIGGRFEMDALRVPAAFDLSVWIKVPKSAMMASLLVGIALLLSVAVELALRNLFLLIRGPDGLADIPETVTLGSGAE